VRAGLGLGLVLRLVAVIAAAPAVAEAGRTPYGWLAGTEVIPERGAELQTWIGEENGKRPGDVHETHLWWGALVGATDRLELALPIEVLWREADGAEPQFTVRWFGAEARYRFVSQDPVEAPPIAPLVRIAVKRDVTSRGVVRAEAEAVASYQSGRLHAVVDVGLVGDLSRDDARLELRPGAGVSIAVGRDLRLGAEIYAELELRGAREGWVAAGPDLAWTHGRFWLSAAFGIGIYHIDTAPRVSWGILF
jgi:hypothetical protein